MANDEHFDATVRSRLKEIRLDKGMTLEELAERANIDKSTLSRLESGKRRLALDHLPSLADALGVRVDDLLPRRKVRDPRIRSAARRFDGLTVWPLSGQNSSNGLEASKMKIHASRNKPPEKLPVHEGHHWMYVLKGKMRLLLGDEDFIVGPGEAVEFSTWTPHWFGAFDGPVEILAILGPEGERIHFHET
ncbi:MAG: helix-turn-helix domain-containing protein [Solirubrobacterales bacterium]|nr:helix-turn-helix domain-containing protein [Solirubrobacterales bacterium]